MTDDQTKEVVQETPQETPPASTGSEEQVKTQETPAPSDSGAPPVETAQKTSEQLEADRAFFQKDAQDTKAQLRAMQKKETQLPIAAKSVQPQQTQQNQMSLDDMNDQLRDNPTLMLQAIAQQNNDAVTNMRQELQRDIELRSQSDEANRIVKDFASRHKIDPKHVNEARKSIEDMGLKAEPAKMAELTLMLAQSNMSRDNGNIGATQAAADAADKIKQQQLTVQPEGGSPSSPKSVSYQEGIAGKFTKPQNKNTLSRLMEGLN